jgi:hypothetical protein
MYNYPGCGRQRTACRGLWSNDPRAWPGRGFGFCRQIRGPRSGEAEIDLDYPGIVVVRESWAAGSDASRSDKVGFTDFTKRITSVLSHTKITVTCI